MTIPVDRRWRVISFITWVAIIGILAPSTVTRIMTTEALSINSRIHSVSYVANSFDSVAKKRSESYNGILTTSSSSSVLLSTPSGIRRRNTCIEMASTTSSSNDNSSSNIDNRIHSQQPPLTMEDEEYDTPTFKLLKPFNMNTIGDITLKAVQSLAQRAGNRSTINSTINSSTTNVNVNPNDDIDGYTKGAFGIANVLTGRGPASRRSRLISWQRRQLRGVRRDTMMTAASMGATGIEEEGGYVVRRGGSEDDGYMTQLVASLPSSKISESRSNSRVRVVTAPIVDANNLERTMEDEDNINTNNETENDSNNNSRNKNNKSKKDPTLITTALATLEKDMALLDNLASLQPQLSLTEVGLLLGAVLASGVGPIAFPGTSVTEVLAPAAAAFTASITIGSEYIGRVALADAKEIAANSIQCAAEAEALLANAERVKAITPLCVGVCATSASFALLTPRLIDALNVGNSVTTMTELYLFCPLVSVLSAAVADLALEETKGFANRAISVGVRRFSKSGNVGRTWLSSSEQIQKNSKAKTERWWSFAGSVLPAPIIGSILGGPSLSTKCIVIAALAAAQSAYFLAQAESVLARATDAVALKARSAAVSDTYANQGARNSAILPFTSALSAFCAAATAATVELPFLENVSTLYGTFGEVALVSAFPILSSGFAAAAAVSKARCEENAEAAAQAASTLALEYDGMDGSGDDPVLRPLQAVRELVMLAMDSGWRSIKTGVINPFANIWRIGRNAILGFSWRRRSGDSQGEGLA